MPKRLIDGDALWVSDKLEQVPVEYRGDYAWLLPLAQVNGCFECNPTVVWRECYAARRPDRTIEATAAILDAFEAAKMLFRFKLNGKMHGFFIGNEKDGRLPGDAERSKYREPWKSGMLPEKELAKFLGVTRRIASERYRRLLAEVSQRNRRESLIGSGSGSGEVLGSAGDEVLAGGVVEGNDTSVSTPTTPLAPPTTSTQHTTSTTTTTPPVKDKFMEDDFTEVKDEPEPVGKFEELFCRYTAKGFAILFRTLMWDNDDATSTPKNWLDLWEPDFKELLRTVSGIELADVILISQTPKNREYYVHPKPIIKNLDKLREWVKEKKKAMPTLRKEFLAQIARLENEYGSRSRY